MKSEPTIFSFDDLKVDGCMGEVEEFGGGVDEREAEGDEGVDTS